MADDSPGLMRQRRGERLWLVGLRTRAAGSSPVIPTRHSVGLTALLQEDTRRTAYQRTQLEEKTRCTALVGSLTADSRF